MDYQFHLGAWKSVFAVPSEVVDKHFKLAGERQLKVLLYLLRYNDGVSEEALCKALGLDADAVADALLFWAQRGLITQSEGEIAPAAVPAASAQTAQTMQTAQEAPEAGKPRESRVIPVKSTHLSPLEIADRVKENAQMKYLFACAEGCFGRPLTHTEQRSLVSMHDYLGLPIDVILMIIEYAQSVGITSARYIETIATGWADKGITDHAQAEEQICRLKQRDSMEAKIKAVCGINRRLTPKEAELAARWAEEYRLDISLIELAYQRTAENTGKASFAYMGKILDGWHAKGITTPEQALTEQLERKKAAQNKQGKQESSYDLDEFERLALLYTPKPPDEPER